MRRYDMACAFAEHVQSSFECPWCWLLCTPTALLCPMYTRLYPAAVRCEVVAVRNRAQRDFRGSRPTQSHSSFGCLQAGSWRVCMCKNTVCLPFLLFTVAGRQLSQSLPLDAPLRGQQRFYRPRATPVSCTVCPPRRGGRRFVKHGRRLCLLRRSGRRSAQLASLESPRRRWLQALAFPPTSRTRPSWKSLR